MSSSPQVRIQSGGRPFDTHVFVDDVELKTVTGVEWRLQVKDGYATAVLELIDVEIEAEAYLPSARLSRWEYALSCFWWLVQDSRLSLWLRRERDAG